MKSWEGAIFKYHGRIWMVINYNPVFEAWYCMAQDEEKGSAYEHFSNEWFNKNFSERKIADPRPLEEIYYEWMKESEARNN